ncbi:MAG: hypothetical protein WBF66_03735 [Dehalococcoidia bacterium]
MLHFKCSSGAADEIEEFFAAQVREGREKARLASREERIRRHAGEQKPYRPGKAAYAAESVEPFRIGPINTWDGQTTLQATPGIIGGPAQAGCR